MLLARPLANSFFASIAAGIQRQLLASDILPVILQAWPEHGHESIGEAAMVRRLVAHRVDALMLSLIDEALSLENFTEALRSHRPIVLLGAPLVQLDADIVYSD